MGTDLELAIERIEGQEKKIHGRRTRRHHEFVRTTRRRVVRQVRRALRYNAGSADGQARSGSSTTAGAPRPTAPGFGSGVAGSVRMSAHDAYKERSGASARVRGKTTSGDKYGSPNPNGRPRDATSTTVGAHAYSDRYLRCRQELTGFQGRVTKNF